ncbi:MAG: hypothetical protein KF681_18150 [Bdellovibrionaceae bacterium]|nr:hypothetical protein [Pseudobdellovibrionaceae bacterium]
MTSTQRTWRGAFPKTIEALGKQNLSAMIESFEFELEVQQLRLDLRWFPVFLKMQNCPRRILELAEFEYLRTQAYAMDMGRPRLDPGMIALNPQAQFVEVHEDLPEIGRGPGLYCLVKSGARFFEMELSLAQALLLDLLREDRKYSSQQLFDMAEIHEVKLGLSRDQWASTLQTLLDRDVVVVGGQASAHATM